MATYQPKHRERAERLANLIRRAVLGALVLFVVIAVSGCGKGEEPPSPTARPTEGTTPVPTVPDAATEPTKTPTPEITAEPTKAPTPEVTTEPTPEAAVTPEITPESAEEGAFSIVTPIPQAETADVKGALTKDTFPRVDGSTATIPLSEALYCYATGASAEEAGWAITHTKTTNSYYRLYAGEVDLLIVYEPAEEIVERMKTEQLLIKPIGLDALVFMANAANPVESLTMEQLVSIYSGDITNWTGVGGENKELLAFQRPSGSGSQTLMQKLVMGDVAMMDGYNVYRYATMSDILEGMLSYIGEDNSLGYSVFYYANNMYSFPELKFMGVNGILPSTQTIYDGSYPLTNAFYAVIRPDEPEDSAARLLFDWLTGAEGQQMILELGYVPVIMPEGGELVTEREPETPLVEVTAHTSLPEGEYYVFFTPQNTENSYGDVTVYTNDWEVCARFYNVELPLYGRYRNRYLPIGQIRQDTSGSQNTFYGIYDLEAGAYSVVPTYPDLVVLDKDKGYYAVVEWGRGYDEYYNNDAYFIINGRGEHLLEGVRMEDWLTISKQGNGYLEQRWNYEMLYSFALTVSYYDENLRLRKVYCTAEFDMPPEEDRLAGVEYYYVGEDGCLIDRDGELLISKEKFLALYGNGTDTECEMSFYGISMEETEDGAVYVIEYADQIYLVDRNLSLICLVEQKDLPVSFVSYYRDFYIDYNHVLNNRTYYNYDDTGLTMQDGTLVDDVQTAWDSDWYVLYKTYQDKIVAEEHFPSEDLICRYEYLQKEAASNFTLSSYLRSGFFLMSERTGQRVPTLAYNGETTMVELDRIALYHGEDKVFEQTGRYGYGDILEDGSRLITIVSEQSVRLETESLFEMEYTVRTLNYYYVVGEDGTLLFAQDTPAYLQSRSDGFLQLEIGNYTYVFDYEGNQYIKALHHSLASD